MCESIKGLGQKKICVLGNATIETKIFLRGFPSKNCEEVIERMYVNVGGSGAHSAVALSSLGFKVYMITQVGIDANGKRISFELKKAHVDLTCMLTSGSETTLFISIFDKNQNRIMLIKPVEWNEKAVFSRLSNIVNTCDILVICPSSTSLVMQAAKLARALRKSIVISPQTAFFNQTQKWLKRFFGFADMIFLNESEICRYMRAKTLSEAIEKSNFRDDQIVVVTMGANGCTVISNEGVMHTPAKQGSIVDSSGAGDSFMAGFIWSLERGSTLKEAANIGCVAGLVTSARAELPEKGLSLKEHLKRIRMNC